METGGFTTVWIFVTCWAKSTFPRIVSAILTNRVVNPWIKRPRPSRNYTNPWKYEYRSKTPLSTTFHNGAKELVFKLDPPSCQKEGLCFHYLHHVPGWFGYHGNHVTVTCNHVTAHTQGIGPAPEIVENRIRIEERAQIFESDQLFLRARRAPHPVRQSQTNSGLTCITMICCCTQHMGFGRVRQTRICQGKTAGWQLCLKQWESDKLHHGRQACRGDIDQAPF